MFCTQNNVFVVDKESRGLGIVSFCVPGGGEWEGRTFEFRPEFEFEFEFELEFELLFLAKETLKSIIDNKKLVQL